MAQTGSGAHSASYPMSTEGYSTGGKVPGSGADRQLQLVPMSSKRELYIHVSIRLYAVVLSSAQGQFYGRNNILRFLLCTFFVSLYTISNKKNSMVWVLKNYTDRATAACRRSDCQLLRIKGATWSTWRIPTAVLSVF
jgi:hypothetical protein